MKNFKNSPLFILSLFGAVLITVMGSWWLYLIFELSSKLQVAQVSTGANIAKIIKWEGSAFVALVLLFFISHTLLFLRDQKKTSALHTFFAGLTHELKTPLASMKLQSEIISLEADKLENEKLQKLTSRLNEDAIRLETQLDKILQLSRVERGGQLNVVSTSLINRIKEIHKNYPQIRLSLKSDSDNVEVYADEFALDIIIKNLFENTLTHTNSMNVVISVSADSRNVTFTYSDEGHFTGENEKLATLFYKHNSTNGSGIGLYLMKKLIEKMQGTLSIRNKGNLEFNITLLNSSEGEQHV